MAHARNVRLIGESRRKDDRFDARTLARLARIDPELLGPVQHRSRTAQADLTAIRARAGLIRARTALINTARGLTKSYGERLRGCSTRKMNRELAQELREEIAEISEANRTHMHRRDAGAAADQERRLQRLQEILDELKTLTDWKKP